MQDEDQLDVRNAVINDKLKEYYDLKKVYEKGYHDKYVKPIVENDRLSKLAKRKEFLELKKPLCINCKQNVGTIFERRSYRELGDKNEVIVFTAKCGDLINPCDLNIEIHKSKRDRYENLINDSSKKLSDFQMKIIKLKNQILFLGKREANENEYINEFNKYKDEILYYSQTLGEYVEENIMVNDNPEENEKLQMLISSLNQNELMAFQDLLNEYMATNDENILKQCTNMYLNEIEPKVKEIRNLKYKTMYINFEGDEKTYNLIQSKSTLQGLNYYDDTVDEVVHFIKGLKLDQNPIKSKLKIPDLEETQPSEGETGKKSKSKSSKVKTLKSIKSSKTKTLKKPLQISPQEPEEKETQEQEQEQEEEEREIQPSQPQKTPQIQEREQSKPIEKIPVFLNEDEDRDEGEYEPPQDALPIISTKMIPQIPRVAKNLKVRGSTNIPSESVAPQMKRIGNKIELKEATEAIE